MRTIPKLTAKEQEVFWKKVNKTPGHGPAGTCWIWTGATVSGYGNVGITRKKLQTLLAHRIAYFLHYGEQPGEVCGHHCDTPTCVNPEHLFSGTQADNIADREAKGRGGGEKRRGANNGRHTMPERTCRGASWHKAHDRPQVIAKKRKSLKRFYKENPKRHQGENNPNVKLSVDDIKLIRAEYAQGNTSSIKLAAKYAVTKQAILSIINRQSWAHVE